MPINIIKKTHYKRQLVNEFWLHEWLRIVKEKRSNFLLNLVSTLKSNVTVVNVMNYYVLSLITITQNRTYKISESHYTKPWPLARVSECHSAVYGRGVPQRKQKRLRFLIKPVAWNCHCQPRGITEYLQRCRVERGKSKTGGKRENPLEEPTFVFTETPFASLCRGS